MPVCKECGVELEGTMEICPLCATPVSGKNGGQGAAVSPLPRASLAQHDEKHLLQHILWQVASILLLSGIVATLIIDLAVHQEITWSIYPVSVCMILFSYASILALWRTRIIYQLLVGCLISILFLALLNILLEEGHWTVQLAMPLLLATNLIIILLIVILRSVRTRGLNVIAFITIAIALLCMVMESIISNYSANRIVLQWSIIVAACLLPVTAALFFMYFRTRNNAALQKIFHN